MDNRVKFSKQLCVNWHSPRHVHAGRSKLAGYSTATYGSVTEFQQLIGFCEDLCSIAGQYLGQHRGVTWKIDLAFHSTVFSRRTTRLSV